MQFIARTKTWFTFSIVLTVISIFGFLAFGFNFGLDFTGGTLLEIKFENKQVEKDKLSSALVEIANNIKTEVVKIPADTKEGVAIETEERDIDIGTPVILSAGEGFIIRIKHIDETTHAKILQELKTKFGTLEEIRFTAIGPVIGATLKTKAVTALVVAMIAIVLYIAFAFRKVPKRVSAWRFGLCAVVALMHDAVVTIGFYVFLSKFFGAEIDGLFVTALLTIIGFSVHDTIVVFDRIRENLKYQKREESLGDIADASLNQTVARSINTSFTALLTLTALALFGSESVFFFAVTLIFGISIGTYSSIFIAAPLLSWWQQRRPVSVN